MNEDFTKGWPAFSDDEIAAVERVLRSGRVNYWTGTETREFEEAFAGYVGSKHAIALANGTVALEVAMRSLGIGPGDDVVVTSRSFVASASSVAICGANPVFADVDRVSQNVTAETIEQALTSATRAILVVHLGGWPCDMDPIMALAEQRRLPIIEDCAQALGARYKGRPVGSWSQVAAWSFCQDKIMTTGGEGGMLTTNDDSVGDFAWSYKDHGKNKQTVDEEGMGPSFKWLHDTIGTNLRMTEMQAAIGNVGLPKVDRWVERRQALAKVLDEHFAAHSAFRTTVPGEDFSHSYYKYYTFVRPEQLTAGLTRDRILEVLHADGIPAFTGICGEIYRERAFGRSPHRRHRIAAELAETALMIPIHPLLSEESVGIVARAVTSIMASAE